jgi:uncharacterized surface protein with fasciclin (FAS1) repeats
MKKVIQSIFGRVLFAALAFSVVLSSCNNNNDDNTPAPTNTIVDVAVGNPNFTYLVAAIQRAGASGTNVAALLSDPNGRYTVFAPTNDAFIAAGFPTIASIQAADPNTLLGILTYHVLNSEVRASQVPVGPNEPVATLAQSNVFVTNNSSGVFVNGIRVAQADVLASNGVIHAIGSVLLPPSGNIVEAAQGNEDLSTLVAAIQYVDANIAGANIATTLSGAGPFTVFAPTNAAFQTLLTDVGATNLSDVAPEVVRDILLRHVIGARVFSSDLSNGSVTTLNGDVTIAVSGNGATVIGAGAIPSNITATNIVTTNGVVHVIDRVIRIPLERNN